MSRKLGIPPTSSCPNRPVLQPFVSEELLGGERGVERGAVSGGGRGTELAGGLGAELDEMSGSGLGGDCGGVRFV